MVINGFTIIDCINTMSIMYDKWTDKNIGLNDGKMSNTPYLEMSIIPAIPITYFGLVGETINIFDIKTNLDDLTNLYNPNNLIPSNNLENLDNLLELYDNNLNLNNKINMLRGLNENK